MTSPSQSRKSSISVKWFRNHKDQKAKEDFEKILRNDGVVLGRLKEIVEELMLENDKITIEDFDSPSWAHKQAFRLGEKRGLEKIRDLLIFIDGE